jgi:RNA polymerase sigma-70 factor, ECF subfamily
MPSPPLDDALLKRLYRQSKAERWHLPVAVLAGALEISAARVFAGKTADARDLERYLGSLHLEDLALACACAAGEEAAWEHFIREQRPVLYRAADQIDRSGGAREIADALYADLYGLRERGGERESLFRHFHGRSSLATWLRAVLAQRHVDRLRTQSRTESLPEENSPAALAARTEPAEPERRRYVILARRALSRAVSRLAPRDRLRLGCYYAQQLTLAEIGRLLREHEATVSRHLARSRKAIRQDVERDLRVDGALSDAEIADCFATVANDPGPIDLGQMLEAAADGKELAPARSNQGKT